MKNFKDLSPIQKYLNILRPGNRISYGARALNEGGFQSLAKVKFSRGSMLGCEAGTLNVLKLKALIMPLVQEY